jgi:hypothetical protein
MIIFSHKCHMQLLQCWVILDKLHKILITKDVTQSQNDICIEMQLTPTFHPVNVAWLLMILWLKIVIEYSYVAWSFMTNFTTKMWGHLSVFNHKLLTCGKLQIEKMLPHEVV